MSITSAPLSAEAMHRLNARDSMVREMLLLDVQFGYAEIMGASFAPKVQSSSVYVFATAHKYHVSHILLPHILPL